MTVICTMCGKICQSNAGLGQHLTYMHSEKSTELRKIRSDRQKGISSPSKGKTKETDPYLARPDQIGKKFGLSLTGHTNESKKKISESMKGNQNAQHRGDRQSYYKNIRMDSRWEVSTAKWLDDNNFQWKYNERGFKLSDGRYYYPDFFIYEDDEFSHLIEVKGYFRDENRKKFNMFLKEYSNIKICLWMKDDLKERKII